MASESGIDNGYTERELAQWACNEVSTLRWRMQQLEENMARSEKRVDSFMSWARGNLADMRVAISRWAARAPDGWKPVWENVKGGKGPWAATPEGEWAGGASSEP